MNIESTTALSAARIQETASVSMLRKSMDHTQQAMLKLLESLEVFQDPALGTHIDTTA